MYKKIIQDLWKFYFWIWFWKYYIWIEDPISYFHRIDKIINERKIFWIKQSKIAKAIASFWQKNISRDELCEKLFINRKTAQRIIKTWIEIWFLKKSKFNSTKLRIKTEKEIYDILSTKHDNFYKFNEKIRKIK